MSLAVTRPVRMMAVVLMNVLLSVAPLLKGGAKRAKANGKGK